MTREYFLERLRLLLFDLPEAEKTEAIRYWSEYFDDAGTENVGDVMKKLGSPEALSKQIHDELGILNYAEAGHRYTGNAASYQDGTSGSEKTNSSNGERKYKTTNIVLWIVVGILSLPIWLPILIGVFAIILSLVIVFFALALSLAISAAALLVAGIFALFIHPLFGLALIAGGMFVAGLTIFAVMLNVWFWGWLVPMCCSKGFRKRRREQKVKKTEGTL